MERNNRYGHSGWIVLATIVAFGAITAFALAIVRDGLPTLRSFVREPGLFFGSAVNANASALPLATAAFGLIIAAISAWSLLSILITEAVLLASSKRASGVRIAKSLLRFSSPLVRPLLRKRIATLALSATIVAGGPAAFADSTSDIPTDLSWQAVTATVPTDLSMTDPTPSASAPTAADASVSAPTPTTEGTVSQTDPVMDPNPVADTENHASARPTQSSTASAIDATNKAPLGARNTPSASTSPPATTASTHTVSAIVSASSTVHAASSSTSEQTYVVVPGDSLWSIASRYFDTANPQEVSIGWQRIYELNKSAIGESPNLIHPGLTLQMPEKEL